MKIVRNNPGGLALFDASPIQLEGVRLKQADVVIGKKITLEQWAAALQFAAYSERASPIWVGKLWNYGAEREDRDPDWRERLPQALADAGLDYDVDTLKNYGSVVKNTSDEALELAPSISHAAIVMALEPKEQVAFMKKARDEKLGTRDLRLTVRASRRKKVVEGQAILEGLHRVLLCDYPWTYTNRPPSGKGQQETYEGLPIDEGEKLGEQIASHMLPKAVGFFWVTAPFLYYCTDGIVPDPLRFIRACGFEPTTGMVWDKVDHVFGNYVSVRHEHLIIATRGGPFTPDRPTPMPDSVVTEKRRPGAEHSEKPTIFHRVIEKLYEGPYLELFGRKPMEGWTVFGNDARLWGGEGAA